jgi:hypothetical protein
MRPGREMAHRARDARLGDAAGARVAMRETKTAGMNPAAPHHLPFFVTPPGQTDSLMEAVALFPVAAVILVGAF